MNVSKEKSAQQLANWVKRKHSGQVKKYTGGAHYKHLLAVAEMAKEATILGYEIGLCHDLLEDTGTGSNELHEALIRFAYTPAEAEYVVNCVTELTDVYTGAAYPDLTRDARKEKEASRLATISPGAQTVKYCDLIYNMELVLRYEKKHAEEYLKKKKLLLHQMINGNEVLLRKALETIGRGLVTLSRHQDLT